jgi:hypothetical protein
MNNRIQQNPFFAGMKARFMLCLMVLALSCSQVIGQVKFSISAPASVAVNQAFQLNVTLENANGSNPRLGAVG